MRRSLFSSNDNSSYGLKGIIPMEGSETHLIRTVLSDRTLCILNSKVNMSCLKTPMLKQ